jgi:hypothetical protein
LPPPLRAEFFAEFFAEAARVGVRRLVVDDFDFDCAADPRRFAVDFPPARARDRVDEDFSLERLPDLPADLPPDLRDAMRGSFVAAVSSRRRAAG